jgi:hypothetical protein
MSILLERPLDIPVQRSDISPAEPTPEPTNHRRRWAYLIVGLVSAAAVTLGLLVSGFTSASSSKPAAPTWATRAVGNFMDRAVPASAFATWQEVNLPSGPRWEGQFSGGNIAEFDATTHELDEVILSHNLSGSTGPMLRRMDALRTAVGIGDDFDGFPRLSPRHAELIDHGAFAEWRFQWQERFGLAWAPSTVVVGINARTGALAYYWSMRDTVRVPSSARVTAATARQKALQVAGIPGARTARPVLEITDENRHQELVWIVRVIDRNPRPHISDDKVVWVDAITGSASVHATS